MQDTTGRTGRGGLDDMTVGVPCADAALPLGTPAGPPPGGGGHRAVPGRRPSARRAAMPGAERREAASAQARPTAAPPPATARDEPPDLLPGLPPPPARAAPPGHLGHRARMRQRLIAAGPDALLDHELLEMTLFTALPRQDTKPLARALIARFGGFAGAIAAPAPDLLRVEGLGEAGLAALKTVQAAALRLARAELRGRPLLDTWDRLADYLAAALAREPVEQVRVLFLDTRNRLIADEAQARGTVNHTPVYPREVVKRALELGATALILVHNHPSGDPTPSRADVEMTAEVKAAAGLLGIVLHDHLIVGNRRHVSLRREGLL
jgi:DNA repair protein RadC